MPRSNEEFSDKNLFSDENMEETEKTQRGSKMTAAMYPHADLTNPSQFRLATRNIANMHGITTPQEREAGRTWYPQVHDAVAKGIKRMGLTHLQGSGLVAAVSPNMDWETNNIHAFKELTALKPEHWDAIHRSAGTGGGPDHVRSEEARHVLRGLSISAAPDGGLVRAHRILQGEDPNEVLRRQTSPKTNSFMSNIHDPEGSPHVTVDSRAHDIANNKMYPWTYSGRGISSADLPSSKRILKSGQPAKSFGKKTRYENFEDAYREAAHGVGEHPTAMQAITWLGGKRVERSGLTKAGKPRLQGPARRGQPYEI